MVDRMTAKPNDFKMIKAETLDYYLSLSDSDKIKVTGRTMGKLEVIGSNYLDDLTIVQLKVKYF